MSLSLSSSSPSLSPNQNIPYYIILLYIFHYSGLWTLMLTALRMDGHTHLHLLILMRYIRTYSILHLFYLIFTNIIIINTFIVIIIKILTIVIIMNIIIITDFLIIFIFIFIFIFIIIFV